MIDRDHLKSLIASEAKDFEAGHPKSRELFKQAGGGFLGGVPMSWMKAWQTRFPVFVERAEGSRVTDVDGHEYIDFFYGITAAMFGHAVPAVVEAVTERVRNGTTFMLPTEDSVWLGSELARRFTLPSWQVALTSTDACRFVIRMARSLTKRQKVLVFDGCYHGTVSDTMARLQGGEMRPLFDGLNLGRDLSETTRIIEFNDVAALESALASGDVACVLTEPVLTNGGMVFPDAGFHDALRRLTRDTGTYLAIDETHTICAGPGGYSAANGLEPNFLVFGKSIAGGVPAAVYGFSAEIAEETGALMARGGDPGIGGTLMGNALSIAAMRAAMEHVMTEEAYAGAGDHCGRLVDGMTGVIEAHALPWRVSRLGIRAEMHFRAEPPRTAAEAHDAQDHDLEAYLVLYSANRGLLVPPFHNTRTISPALAEADIDRHTEVFRACIETLTRAS
jgi:glutamate-1-semialdehyde 2,1-aminomutase